VLEHRDGPNAVDAGREAEDHGVAVVVAEQRPLPPSVGPSATDKIVAVQRLVCLVPLSAASICSNARVQSLDLLDHLVGHCQQLVGYFETECPGGFVVDHQFELGRLHDRHVGGLPSFENAASVNAG
jgi:hypothetical protein